MSGTLAPQLRQRFFDSNGDPLASGKLYAYQAGTTTPQDTYTDQTLGTANANPVVLDANGEADVWLDPELSYKFVLKNSNDVTQWTVDAVVGLINESALITSGLQALTSPDTADLLRIQDVTAGIDRKITLGNLWKAVSTFTAGTAPIGADLLAIYDSANALAKKITLSNLITGQTEDTDPQGNDEILLYDTSAGTTKKTSVSNMPYGPNPNFVINSSFRFGQEFGQLATAITSATTPANNDDTYIADQWILLSDGNDIVDVEREYAGSQPVSGLTHLKLDVETANKKFGIIQPFEFKTSYPLRYGAGHVSLSFKAKAGPSNATLTKLRAAVLAWTGSGDSITSDCVSSWGAEGVDPTLATDWTYENTPSDLALTTSYQTFKIEGIPLDTAATQNIAIFIWADNDDSTIGDLVYVADVKLEAGTVATPYYFEPFDKDLRECERFYEKSYDLETKPGTATTSGSVTFRASGANADVPIQMKTRKRAAPTVTLYSPATGASGNWRDASAGADVSFSSGHIGEAAFEATSSGTTDGRAIQGHWVASARL